jgi:hypothetical protein
MEVRVHFLSHEPIVSDDRTSGRNLRFLAVIWCCDLGVCAYYARGSAVHLCLGFDEAKAGKARATTATRRRGRIPESGITNVKSVREALMERPYNVGQSVTTLLITSSKA